MGKAVIAIHGGAGAISRAQMSLQQELRYIEALSAIVETGQKMLVAGESALDVVTEAVRLLEECPLFNAGIGAVFTRDETHELDACVMDGNTLKAGAVAALAICVIRFLRPTGDGAKPACDDDWRRGRKFCVCSWHGARLAGDFLHTFAL
ncbi:putative L-asparaginase [Escherichia coli]|uniref:Putative L-asparaginase n=1 Tax=Escherichia coli TaxID=562 RepID=A0A377K9G7_ECOLX|nr:putative L-asparaginase [Escherichia coli]